jgi:hypothetical protein
MHVREAVGVRQRTQESSRVSNHWDGDGDMDKGAACLHTNLPPTSWTAPKTRGRPRRRRQCGRT